MTLSNNAFMNKDVMTSGIAHLLSKISLVVSTDKEFHEEALKKAIR